MIVAYNALSLRPGVVDGAATFTLNVLRYLPQALPEARILVYARAAERRIPSAPNLEVVHVPWMLGPVGRSAFESFALGGALARRRVHVFLSPNESLPLRLSCRLVVVAQNVVYHCAPGAPAFTGITIKDKLLTRIQFAYWRVRMRGAYRRAHIVAVVSEEAKRVLTLRAGLDARRAVVVHEGADSFLLPEHAHGDRQQRLLVVSALAPYKGIEETLQVFSLLRRRRPEYMLVLVGTGWRGFEKIVHARVAELGLEDAVTVTGGLDGAEVAGLYATSQVLLSFSRCESFGLPLVEAMRYGLPVVAAARSSLPEVTDGAAMLVDPGDLEETARSIERLLDDESARGDLAARGLARAADLSWRRTAAALGDAVRAAADADHHAGRATMTGT